MPSPSHTQLARRERQIMEIVYRLGQATEQAVAALLDMSQSTLSEDDLDQLSGLIDKARKEGR